MAYEEDPKALVNDYWEFDPTEALPVEHGIQAHSQTGRFAQSWWGGRWIKALTQLTPSSRLARGRTYARHGQVVSLDVQVGMILAQVQGTRPTPYRVRIVIQTLSDAEGQQAIDAMASQALYAVQLLNGEMPHEIEEVFRSVGVDLFPEAKGDLVGECTCPDWASPCKHVAAVCLLLAEMLDNDPFLLFVMRGRRKEQIIAALREKRAEHAAAPALSPETSSTPIGISNADLPLEACLESFWHMGSEISAIQVHVAPPEIEMEVVKVLGNPTFAENEALNEHLAEIYRTVSRKALDVAFGER
jgi:uncharacterized Zn finger protein